MIIRLGVIHMVRMLTKKKEELENKNEITDKEDVFYVQICEQLKFYNKYLDITRELYD